MSEAVNWNGQMPAATRASRQESQQQPARQSSGGGDNLADILERVLDKGIVIAGDIQINLLDIELLTIKIRLVVASVDRAKEMGIDWWERDPTLSSGYSELEEENRMLRDRLARLEDAGEHAAIDDAEVDDEPVDDEPADDELADDELADDEPVDDEPVDAEDEDAPDGEPADEPEPAPRRRRARR